MLYPLHDQEDTSNPA